MIKKFIICAWLLTFGLCANTGEVIPKIKGFQNIAEVQKLDVINKLSAIADNDNSEFPQLWSGEYFEVSGVKSYIFVTENEPYSFEIIKFDIPKVPDNCFTKDNPEFCIPKIQSVKESYLYDGRYINETIPDFVDNPQREKITEMLIQDGKYFDKMPIKTLFEQEGMDNVYRKCEFEFNRLKSCQTLSKDTDKVIFTEVLEFKEPLIENDENYMNKLFKYVKYNSAGKKIEEYNFSKNKHIFYDEEGVITALEQFTDSNFKYSNSKNPDLNIDVEFKYDPLNRLICENHYDANHKLVRRYSADYQGTKIEKILVEDLFNNASWEILPIPKKNSEPLPFSLRY